MKKLGVILVPVLIITLLISAAVNFSSVNAQTPGQQTGEENRTVSVTGSGSVAVQPDTAVIVVGVRTEAEDASDALNQNNQQMESLINALLDAGIAQEDIQTRSINLSPRYSDQPGDTGQPQVTGYIATNTVEVRVGDIDQVGQILDTAVQEGSNLIENIRFEVSDSQQVQQQARQSAFNDAQQKAQQLASLAGAQLGQVLMISENTSFPRPFATGGGAVAEAAVPVEPGTQNVVIDLQVTWELVGGTAPGAGETETPGVPPTGPGTATPTPFVPDDETTTPTPIMTEDVTVTPTDFATVEVPTLDATIAVPTLEATIEVPTLEPTDEEPTGGTAAEQLRAQGAEVQLRGNIIQPFFPVIGRMLSVNGTDVQVFAFDNQADANRAAATISQTGGQVGTIAGQYIGQPHFFHEGDTIVLYVGENQNMLDLLSDTFGDELAG